MFSTDFILRQQENLVDNYQCQAGFRPLLMQQNTISTYHIYPFLGEHHNALLMKHGYDSSKIPSEELEKIQNLALPNYFV